MAALVNCTTCKTEASIANATKVLSDVRWGESPRNGNCLADSSHFSLFMFLIISQFNETLQVQDTDLTFKNQMSHVLGPPFKLT